MEKRSINEIGRALRSIKEHLNSVYRARLKQVIVYGSFAKGEANEGSEMWASP